MANALLVLHDPMTREMLAGHLRTRGHVVRCVGGASAPSGMNGKIDVMVLDAELPHGEAWRLLDAKAHDPALSGVPALLLAQVRSKDDLANIARRGVRHVLLKSAFSLEAFDLKLEACLRGGNPASAEPPATDAATSVPAAVPAPLAAPARAEATSQEASRASLKAMDALVSPEELRRLIEKSGELHALSPAVSRVMQMANRPDVNIEELAKVIKQDPAISMKVLKVANSAVYARGTPVDTVLLAVRRVGMEQIRQTVLSIGIVEGFAESGKASPINMHLFWEHSLAVGLFASALVSAAGGANGDADAAFTMGLLHDVGRVILAEHFGERYAKVIETARRLELPLEIVEKKLIGMSHADLMDRLLTSWRFASTMVKPVVLHHATVTTMQQTAPSAVRACLAVALADRLSHAMLLGASGGETIAPPEEMAKPLGVSEAVLGELLRTIPPQVEELKVAMLAAGPAMTWPSRVKDVMARLPQGAAPALVGVPRVGDSGTMLAEALRGACGEQPANLAIVSAPTAEAQAGVVDSLTALDKAAGHRVPALVLAWPSDTAPALGDRRTTVLRGPFQLETFCRAADGLLRAA